MRTETTLSDPSDGSRKKRKRSQATNMMLGALNFYLSAMLCWLMGFGYANQLKEQGYIHIGKGYDGYIDVYGADAATNVRAFFFGASVLLGAGIVQTVRALFVRNRTKSEQRER